MEDSPEAIYELQDKQREPVVTSRIAESVAVTPPTILTMLDTVTDRGIVKREAYTGATLTEEGRPVALEVLRHHRLLEASLPEHLAYEWTDVHDEADVLEHYRSEEFEQRVAAALDEPIVDPHGDPIAGENLEPVYDESTVLASYDAGEQLVAARTRDTAVMASLVDLDLSAWLNAVVREGNPVELDVVAHDGGAVQLPSDVVRAIHVRPAEEGGGEVAG